MAHELKDSRDCKDCKVYATLHFTSDPIESLITSTSQGCTVAEYIKQNGKFICDIFYKEWATIKSAYFKSPRRQQIDKKLKTLLDEEEYEKLMLVLNDDEEQDRKWFSDYRHLEILYIENKAQHVATPHFKLPNNAVIEIMFDLKDVPGVWLFMAQDEENFKYSSRSDWRIKDDAINNASHDINVNASNDGVNVDNNRIDNIDNISSMTHVPSTPSINEPDSPISL